MVDLYVILPMLAADAFTRRTCHKMMQLVVDLAHCVERPYHHLQTVPLIFTVAVSFGSLFVHVWNYIFVLPIFAPRSYVQKVVPVQILLYWWLLADPSDIHLPECLCSGHIKPRSWMTTVWIFYQHCRCGTGNRNDYLVLRHKSHERNVK